MVRAIVPGMRPAVPLIVLCAVSLLACAEKRPAAPRAAARTAAHPTPSYATGRVIFETRQGGIPIRVQVADTDEKRAQGLMYRKKMAADAGMLFLFPHEAVQTFWMRNTYIPLDMIFIDTHRRVVGIVESATPLTESPRSVWRRARYVVEVNAELARINGIRAGTRVRFEGIRSPLLVPP